LPSSSAAAKEAIADPSGETAAIASRVAADFYGMKILAADIETSPLNTTRFWILGRETPPGTGRDRTTLLIAGDLHEALAMLINGGIRILSSYERPSGGKIENALYFIDVAGHIHEDPFSRTLRHVPGGRWLGSYPRKY
jgi:chorismate mutase/prephenate dehydratase